MKSTHHLSIAARAQRGQAIVEALVATTLATSVLFIAIAMLGKLADVRNKTLLGARYAAWERSVWLDETAANAPTDDQNWFSTYGAGALQLTKSDREIGREFIQRTIAANGAPILHTDRDADRLPAAMQALWRDHGGRPLLAAAQDVVVATGAAPGPAAALAQYTSAPYGSLRMADGSGYAAVLDLPTRNLQSGTLSVSVGKQSDVLKRLWSRPDGLAFDGLTFTDTNVLLTDTWLPEGSANSRALFARAVPAAHAALVAPSLYQGLRRYAPEIDTLEFGRIRHEAVPDDRLSR
jgi:hypothetical protein